MRIGVDARELCGNPTGVGRHLSGLLRAWSKQKAAERHTFFLYAHEAVTSPLATATLRVVPGSPGTWWEQISLPAATRRDHLDIFFAPGYTAPILLGTPTVLVVHDVSFVAHPEWFRWKEGLRRRTMTRWSSRHASLVLAVSEAARREIISHFSLDPARVRCIYPGITAFAGQAPDARGPLVLYVGSVFNRRHLPDLIGAFKPVAAQHAAARLEIVGDNRTHPHEDLTAIAVAQGVASQVSIRSYVPDDELAELYSRARAFAFLSEYEGFGHPPLEALSAGVPPVLLETDVAREVCGDAAIYVANGDTSGITTALRGLLFDEGARRRVLNAAPAVLERYSWSRAGAETLAALEEVSASAAQARRQVELQPHHD
jgi:glycosyltransferase involved in cell wall biosynthesis